MILVMYSVGFFLILSAVLRRAFAEIKPSEGEGLDTVWGHVFLAETAEGVFITGDIEGLKPGRHGFHVHQAGDLSEKCKSMCAHFNPTNKKHGGRNSKVICFCHNLTHISRKRNFDLED